MSVFEDLVEATIKARMGYRRKLVYLKRLAWAYKKSIKNKERDIFEKYCGFKPPIVDPKNGQVNLKFDPKDINKDYYL